VAEWPNARVYVLGLRVWISPGAWMPVYCECVFCQVEVSASG
jgi:hypothetical protein